jgi:hypothetical protein
LLIAAWVAAETAGFLGYLLPWRTSLWLADIPLLGPLLTSLIGGRAGQAGDSAALWPAFGLILLGLDLVAAQHAAWRQRSRVQFLKFLIAAFAAMVLLGLVLAQLLPTPPPKIEGSPLHLTHRWYELPLYAMMRVVPNKLLGVIVMFVAMFMPGVWPWMRVGLLRAGGAKWAWRLSCVAFAAVWIGLGYLGAHEAEEPVQTIARALTILYFAFFLSPFAVSRIGRPPGAAIP